MFSQRTRTYTLLLPMSVVGCFLFHLYEVFTHTQMFRLVDIGLDLVTQTIQLIHLTSINWHSRRRLYRKCSRKADKKMRTHTGPHCRMKEYLEIGTTQYYNRIDRMVMHRNDLQRETLIHDSGNPFIGNSVWQ